MIKSYLKTAWRSLKKNKGISALNIAGLSVGMTAAVLILLWVQNEISYDGYHKDADKIYRMTTRASTNTWVWEGSPMLLADAVKKEVPGIQKMARLYVDNWPVIYVNNVPEYEKQCAYVDKEWFDLFQYRFIEGDAGSFDQGPNHVILTAATAKKYFGKQTAIGKIVRIDSLNYEVKGVVADAPANSSFQYRAFLPISAALINPLLRQSGENWDNTDYLTFLKFDAGTSPAAAAKKMTGVLQRYSHDDDHVLSVGLVGLKDMHFESDLQGSEFEHGSVKTVYVFSVLGFLLLLVACINYVNLTTAKASLRAKEVSIRKIVGADRRQLFYQFVAESLLISFFALLITLLLIDLCLPAFNLVTGKEFVFSLFSPDMWKVLGTALGVSFLLNSIYPALVLSSFKPLNIFRGITLLKVKDVYLRKGLVVLQFSISVILIIGTIVIYDQLQFIQKNNPGYDKSQVLVLGGFPPNNVRPEDRTQLMKAIKQELLSHSSIERVSMVNQPIVRISSATNGADWDGRPADFKPKVAQLSADADLPATMHLKMAAGRWFDVSGADKQNFVLNETAVREMNIPAPVLGRRFTMHGKTGQVIGIVKDFNYKSAHEKRGPLVIFNNAEWQNFFLVRATAQSAAIAARILETVWKKMVPGVPVEYSFLDDRFDALYRQDRQASLLICVFAVIAVIISALGLFGLAAFEAEQRTKELGIRKILGATLLHIGALLSRDFVKLVCLSILLAVPVAWWAMDKWLQNFAYRIELAWWMFGSAGLLALIVALSITGYHAIRANVINPVKSLRTE